MLRLNVVQNEGLNEILFKQDFTQLGNDNVNLFFEGGILISCGDKWFHVLSKARVYEKC